MLRLHFDGRQFRGDILQKAHSLFLKHSHSIPSDGSILSINSVKSRRAYADKCHSKNSWPSFAKDSNVNIHSWPSLELCVIIIRAYTQSSEHCLLDWLCPGL